MVINRRTVIDSLVVSLAKGTSAAVAAQSLIKLLTRGNQITLLPSIMIGLADYANQLEISKRHKIILARESDMVQGIPEKILAKYASSADMGSAIVRYDGSLIGGFVVECNDMRYDYSVRGLVEQLRAHYERAL